jgi:hypothetical protein
MRSRIADASGAPTDAVRFALQAVASAQTEQSGDPILDRYRVAAAYRLLGDVRRHAGDRDGASAAWTQGLAQLPSQVTERPVETFERAGLLQRLGRNAEAASLTADLARLGYHSVI